MMVIWNLIFIRERNENILIYKIMIQILDP